jgi:hypothetical protein
MVSLKLSDLSSSQAWAVIIIITYFHIILT